MAITLAEVWQEIADLLVKARTAEAELAKAQERIKELEVQQKPKRKTKDANSSLQKAGSRN